MADIIEIKNELALQEAKRRVQELDDLAESFPPTSMELETIFEDPEKTNRVRDLEEQILKERGHLPDFLYIIKGSLRKHPYNKFDRQKFLENFY